ncbi:hypothetical protein [Halodesulfovibrio marinisediminis]|uniref:Uncharacterized protein n=1 Tax=Halodesulfovibrio marinisediminis DSM 17456 TaxID=1121457 RepID=A0A1N6IG76_9BACT|nr:hypothetical protein [Halodesulfovibrio marinisediminis]SIO31020.1 hypothetical protein SAMN02745161_2722 [Halodesulfovibrio marinisediminis DSM 17456]
MSIVTLNAVIDMPVPETGTSNQVELIAETDLNITFNPKMADYSIDDAENLVITFANGGSYVLQNFSEFMEHVDVRINNLEMSLQDLLLGVTDVVTAAGGGRICRSQFSYQWDGWF